MDKAICAHHTLRREVDEERLRRRKCNKLKKREISENTRFGLSAWPLFT